MQTHGGEAAARVIESNQREFQAVVAVDWGRNGKFDHNLSNLDVFNLEEVTVDRALAGTAPAELLLIEGAAAAQLTVTLGGEYEGMPATAVFSPYNVNSPLYAVGRVGAEIVFEIAVITEMGAIAYPQFVGNVRTIEPDRATGKVKITALDRVEVLRKPVLLPPWAMSDEHVNYGEIDSQLCHSHWVIDNCLRLCDVAPEGVKRPTFRSEMGVPDDGLDGVQVFVTGNGSYIPTVGYLDNPNADSFPATKPMYTGDTTTPQLAVSAMAAKEG